MARPLLDDELWSVIEPLLPPPKPRRFKYPGRKPLDRRKALTGILFVLKTGIPWEYLPQEMGCGCGMSCWRYLDAWQKAGVWEKVHKVLLDRLRAEEGIDLSAAVVDSSHVRAVGGAKNGSQPRGSKEKGVETPHHHGCGGGSAGRSAHGWQSARRDGVDPAGGCHSSYRREGRPPGAASDRGLWRPGLRFRSASQATGPARHPAGARRAEY